MGILLFVLKYMYITLLLKMINGFSWPGKIMASPFNVRFYHPNYFLNKHVKFERKHDTYVYTNSKALHACDIVVMASILSLLYIAFMCVTFTAVIWILFSSLQDQWTHNQILPIYKHLAPGWNL